MLEKQVMEEDKIEAGTEDAAPQGTNKNSSYLGNVVQIEFFNVSDNALLVNYIVADWIFKDTFSYFTSYPYESRACGNCSAARRELRSF